MCNTETYYTEASHFINVIVHQIINEDITVVAWYDNHSLTNYIINIITYLLLIHVRYFS
jgi:hypothetical protein